MGEKVVGGGGIDCVVGGLWVELGRNGWRIMGITKHK